MILKNDIETIEDIRCVVDTFYGKVKFDPLIGPIFIGAIRDRWPAHLEKMYRFWQTVLLGGHTYSGSPFIPHATMPLQEEHFERWLLIWNETIDGMYRGARADEAKWRGERMAMMFLSKIEYYRNSESTPLR